MLLVYLLIIAIGVLLAFSLSKAKGKNTIHARKQTKALIENRAVTSQISLTNVSEAN